MWNKQPLLVCKYRHAKDQEHVISCSQLSLLMINLKQKYCLHVTHIVNRARKGLLAVKTMARAKMPQHILPVLFKSLVLSVIDYGLGLLTLSATQLQRLDVIQNEGMRSILGCTRDTSAEAMRYLLDLPPMRNRHIQPLSSECLC